MISLNSRLTLRVRAYGKAEYLGTEVPFLPLSLRIVDARKQEATAVPGTLH